MAQRSILLIEDSKLHQTFIDRALRRANYDLTLASTGIEGLSALTKKKFDLVIVDLALPDINGLSVVRTIRDMKQVENIPVIIFTSHMPLEDRKDLDELNVTAYIEKGSFKPNELIDLIEESIESVLYLRAIELMVIESSKTFEQYLRKLLPESRAHFSFVEDRHGLENFLSESIPDVIIFHQRDSQENNFTWIARHYQDGLFKGIPWLVVMEQEIPGEMTTISHNRLILPVRFPCSNLVVKKSIELLAHVHQTKLGSEEHSLELEIAYNELEKNRATLSEVKSELALRKKNLGDVLLKIGKEIRQPLTTILGYAEGLKHDESENHQSETAINSILNNGKYLAQVVDDILSIAAIEKGYFSIQKKSFDIIPVLSEIFEVAQRRARSSGLSLSILFDSDIPTEIFSDPTLIKQLLRGLIDNALKFTAEGTIQLRVKYDATYNNLRLAVSDTGPGIAAERIPSLFDGISGPGDVASQVGSGNGLGLAFVKFATERLGGEVQVVSNKGEGTTFTLIIDPGEVQDTCSAELAHTIIELGADESKLNSAELIGKVLILDTHVETRRLFGFLLQKTGIEFTFVKESIEVFDLALSGDYDILLTDIMTAQTDGFALVRNLRKRGFGKPILTVSSCAFEDQRQRCLDVGCDKVLEKPFTLDKFYQTLEELLNTRRPILTARQEEAIANRAAEATAEESAQAIPAELLPDFIELDSAVVPLVLEFIDCLSVQLAQLEQARQSHAWPEIIEAALELYGSAEMYGYSLLSETAKQLDEAAQAENANKVGAAIEKLGQVAAAIERGRPQLLGTIGVSNSSSSLRAVTAEIENLFIPNEPLKETSEPIVPEPTAPVPEQVNIPFSFDFDEAFLTDPILAEVNEAPVSTLSNEITQVFTVTPQEVKTLGKEDTHEEQLEEKIEFPAASPATPETSKETVSAPITYEVFDELHSRLTLIDDAVQAANWSYIGEIVNELSGTAVMYGLSELSNKLLQMKALCGLQDRDEVKLALQEIKDVLKGLPLVGNTEATPVEAAKEVVESAHQTIIIESELVKVEPSTAPLVLDFLDELKALIEALRTAFDQQDWGSVRDIADEVYGSAGICGYSECANVARSLKVAANVGETEGLSSTFSEFNSICEAMFRGRDRLIQ